MRARTPALAAVAAVAVAFAPAPSVAESRREPQIVDARGDTHNRSAAHDVVSATFDTSKRITTRVVGNRRVTTVTPLEIVISLELAAAPVVEPATSYLVAADTAACGSVFAYVRWDAIQDAPVSGVETNGCGGTPDTPASLRHDAYLTARGIEWRIPIGTLPRQLRVGELFYDLQAYTGVADPVFGYTPADFVPVKFDRLVSYDAANSGEDYRLGS